MNVGFFSPTYPGICGDGGIGTYTRHLAHALATLGCGVHVLIPDLGTADVRISDGQVSVYPTRDSHFPFVERLVPGMGACCRIGLAMRQLVKSCKLDVVEFPNWEGFGLGYLPVRRAPLVVRLSTSSLEAQQIDKTRNTRIARWDVRRERWLARSANALLTHSEAHQGEMAKELEIDPQRIAVIPLGISIDPVFQRPERQGDDLEVVYLGRLEHRKGTIDLLHAIPMVLADVPKARFTLIGVDRPHCPGGRTHQQYIEEEFPAQVLARITLAGRLPDEEVRRRLRTADLFVAPSLYESFGLIYLEAMRWGTPVVGTRVGAIPEIIQDGVSGVLVPPKTPAQLAGAITNLLRDENRRQQLGEAGRRRVEQYYNMDQIARQVVAFYARVIGDRS